MRRGYGEVLALRAIAWSGPQLAIRWSMDAHLFGTTLWYESVDWDELERVHGREVVAALAFHIAMFEVDKGVSFAPTTFIVEPPWDRYVTDPLVELWRAVVRNVWAQWRYEHGLPSYAAPDPATPRRGVRAVAQPAVAATSDAPALWFCGGGKDSLLAADALDHAGVSYEALAYTHSVYGPASRQMELIQRLVDHTGARRTHRLYVYDDAVDLPVGRLGVYGDVRYVLAAETPASVFAALPIALAHGHRHLVVAHERSASAENLVWRATGEGVNHQWGKSLAAERLLDEYVSTHVVSGLRYYSVLGPVHDVAIFAALRAVADRVPFTHSCNVSKPWCLRCAKCAYVWICAKAWLPDDVVNATFGVTNLLDLAENQLGYRQMLGLEEHTPFECIGQIEETRLAFAMARARGTTGLAMGHFDEVEGFSAAEVLERFLTVDRDSHRIPPTIAAPVLAYFDDRVERAREFAVNLLAARPWLR